MKNARALFATIAIATAACSGSQAPAAPTSLTSEGGTALKVTEPTPVSPNDGSRVDTRQPTLVVNNPTAPHATDATLMLRFVVQDAAGNVLHASAPVALGTGTTSYALPMDLDYDRTFRWFAEVVWNESPGPSSSARSFATPVPPAPPAPPADNCPGSSPIAIVACQRGKAPSRMSSSTFVMFLRAIARNLNDNGVPGGPFGVLRKATGNNCGGYSCDIICAGEGRGQRQWDVLLDIEGAQAPVWDGPHTGGDIRPDVCEIP